MNEVQEVYWVELSRMILLLQKHRFSWHMSSALHSTLFSWEALSEKKRCLSLSEEASHIRRMVVQEDRGNWPSPELLTSRHLAI